LFNVNFTLVIFAASFIIYAYLMKLVFFDKLLNLVNTRDQHIDKLLIESRNIQGQIEEQIKNSSSSSIMVKAKQEAQQIINDKVQTASKQKDGLVSGSSGTIKNSLVESLQAIDKEQRQVLSEMQSIVSELTETIVGKINADISNKKVLNV
jgi:F0F1-type ATP synthase membrane subunit b/b'